MKSLESSRWSRAAKTSAALFLFISLLAIIPIASATVITNNFEGLTVGQAAPGWNNLVATANAHSGTRGGVSTGDATFTTSDCTSPPNCGVFCGETISFYLYINSFPGGGTRFFITGTNTLTNVLFNFPPAVQIGSSGAVSLLNVGSPSVSGPSLSLNTWYFFSYTMSGCGAGSTLSGVIGPVSYTGSYAGDSTGRGTIFKIQSGATMDVDDFGSSPPYGGLTPAATSVAQTGIVGFDILKNGGNVATRNGAAGSQAITVMDGTTLAQTANLATQCNRLHGLTSLGDQGWAYIHCNSSGSHNPDAIIEVNGIGGASFPFNPACSQTHYSCDASIDISGSGISSGDRDSLSDLAAGIAGEYYQTGVYSGINTYLTGFNIATTQSANSDGLDMNMGWVLQKSDPDSFSTATATVEHFHSTTTADTTGVAGDICGFGNQRIFRTVAGSPTKGYTINIRNNANVNPFSSDPLPAPTYTQTFTGGVDALLTGTFIDCASDRIIVDSSTQLSIWNYATNSLVLTKTITGGSFNAISGNGSYAAYSDGTQTHIISGTTGSELGFIVNPSTLIDMEMDQCAQNLYLATSTNTYRYNITSNTTGTVVGVSNGSCVVDSGITNSNSNTGTASSGSNTCGLLGCSTGTRTGNGNNVSGPAQHTGNPLGDLVQFIKNSWGFDWSWIIGAVLMVICLVGVDKATKGSALADSLVIVLVAVANIKLGLWPEWSLILLAFLIIAVAGNRMFNREREDTA